MTGAAKWLRRFEIALVVVGISILGGVLAATVWRWEYQDRQEQALMRQERAVTRTAHSVVARTANSVVAETQLVEARKIVPAADPLAFARIEIPRVGVSAIVRQGVDEVTLAIAVGHIGGTAFPGEEGNVALAGHRDTFFRGLRDIQLDDRVRLDVPPHSYEYRVVSLEVVSPKEIRVLEPTGGQELTLVTCHPFAFIGRAPNRFIVRATRVN